jgi:hypothetical protein
MFSLAFPYTLVCYVAVVLVQFKPNVVAVGADTGDCGCARAYAVIKNGFASVGVCFIRYSNKATHHCLF